MSNFAALLTILLAFAGAIWLRFGNLSLETSYLLVLLVGLLTASIVMPATGAFRKEYRWEVMRKIRRLLAGWALVVMFLVALASMLKVTAVYSRIWFGYWVLLGTFGLIAAQLIEYAWLKSARATAGRSRKLVLVGAGSAAERVEEQLHSTNNHDLQLVARFGRSWSGREVGEMRQLAEFVHDNDIRDVWIAVPLEDIKLLEQALDALKEVVVDVHVVPDLYQYRLLNQNISEWNGLPLISLSGTPMTGSELRLKALLDFFGSALLLILLSPVFLVVALAVRLTSPGPVFFAQPRHGVGGETINVLKFRTMKLHTEAGGVVTQARPDDDRVTRVGRFLRRTSLDELPQLLNVLKGEMSLVGPRPHAVQHNRFFRSRIPRYMLRHKVRPGITGWAQVNGFRGITETEDKMARRIEHDLWYIQNWSLWLDFRILLMTPLSMIHRNAF